VQIEDERERAAHAAERERGAGGADVKSVMPGIVVDVLVSAGQAVEKGQPLLILEAMKMQNEIQAPQAGRVASLHVQKGATVGNGALLVRLEARPDSEG
jgi:biotin carboxyl carrier protein